MKKMKMSINKATITLVSSSTNLEFFFELWRVKLVRRLKNRTEEREPAAFPTWSWKKPPAKLINESAWKHWPVQSDTVNSNTKS